MNKRITKKYAKKFMDRFTKTKIPDAFKSEAERRQFVKAWSRSYVWQSANYPE